MLPNSNGLRRATGLLDAVVPHRSLSQYQGLILVMKSCCAHYAITLFVPARSSSSQLKSRIAVYAAQRRKVWPVLYVETTTDI